MSSEKEKKLSWFNIPFALIIFSCILFIVFTVLGEIEDYKKIHELGYCCACYGKRPEKMFIAECECECHNTCCCSSN